MNSLNGQIWKHSLAIPDTFNRFDDLIIFHSFITNNYQTYHYAEKGKILFSDEQLEFVYDITQLNNTVEKMGLVDFKNFPISVDCNFVPENKRKFKYIDYKAGFEKFIELKSTLKKSINGKYNLYNLICLFEFARSYDLAHRLFRNIHIQLSFYIAILESLIGKPESCKNILKCDKCGVELQNHSKTSLEKHFNKYFEQFKNIRNIRHKTFHGGDFFDFNEYFSNLIENKANWSEDEKVKLYMHKREEIECVIRVLLTCEFFDYYDIRKSIA